MSTALAAVTIALRCMGVGLPRPTRTPTQVHNGAHGIHPGSPLREPDAAEQILEAGVGAEGVEARVGLRDDQQRIALLVGALEPGHRLVRVAQPRVRKSDEMGWGSPSETRVKGA